MTKPQETVRELKKKTYPRLFAALAVFQRQRRDCHPEWHYIVGLEISDSKSLDDAQNLS